MKKLIILIVLSMFFVQCARPPESEKKWTIHTIKEWSIPSKDKSKFANFVLNCIKNTNPKEDDDFGEYVEECKDTAKLIYLKSETVFYYYTQFRATHSTPCSKAKTKEEKFICGLK